ncbi:hypothetical protein F9L06_03825 [Brucella anthropi]|uniref:Uncharacterized protein n=1 Tax=Brucella anthropi TaxID=529 RepID=A0A6I0DU79_BRUAN|nr:hypothetical protein [Brucella anthropi]KAB2803296.1 hypothetical protein F9L06_03825 [Brucella anthropi]
MDKLETSVKLISPAKINGEWQGAGQIVMVTQKQLLHLVQAKAVDPSVLDDLDDGDDRDLGNNDFDRAVAAKAEQIVSETMDTIVSQALTAKEAEINAAADLRVAKAEQDATAQIEAAQNKVNDQIAAIREEARKASVENISSIVDWLKVEENTRAVSKLSEEKAAKAVSEALGREITAPEFKTAAAALSMSK